MDKLIKMQDYIEDLSPAPYITVGTYEGGQTAYVPTSGLSLGVLVVGMPGSGKVRALVSIQGSAGCTSTAPS